MSVTLLLIVLLLLSNAFFVGAEFGLVSARRSAIELQALNGSRRAKITLNAMERISVMLAGAQLGITLCSLGLGAIGEPFIAHFLEQPFHNLGVAPWLLHPASFVVALLVLTYLHVVFGEMIPKNIALAGPDRVTLVLTPVLAFVVRLLYPAVISLNVLANITCRLLGIPPKNEVASTFTRDEVAGFVEESHREGLLSEDKEHLLSGTLHFDERTIRSVLLPTDKLVAISSKATAEEVEKLAAETGYSRFPVYHKPRKFIGYLHLKDILDLDEAEHTKPIPRRKIRALVTLRANEPLRSALTTMRHSGAHLAQVVSSDGMLGMVALEDILEEIVGEIRDGSQKITDSSQTQTT